MTDDPEYQRLQALTRYAILDTLPEMAFDRLTRLAARHFGVPIALISLVDESRQWFKSCYGLDLRQTDRSLSFCAHALRGRDVLVVPDATQDARFQDNPLVTGEPHIRFYAGAPLLTPDGHALGTLCVISPVPRADFSEDERVTLSDLAALAMDELELRLSGAQLAQRVEDHTRLLTALREESRLNRALLGVQELLELNLEPLEIIQQALPLLAVAADLDGAQLVVAQHGSARRVLSWERTGSDWSAWHQLPRRCRAVGGRCGRPWRGGRRCTWTITPGCRTRCPSWCRRAGAWLPLGGYDGQRYLLGALRLRSLPWRQRDRALLAAGARSIRAALEVRERARHQQRALHTDPLTGLENRRALEAALAAQPSGLLAVTDLNGLKAVNDHRGHAQGDALLRLFATSLSVALPPGARAFRLGGDEFALLHAGVEGDLLARDGLLSALDAAVAAVRAAGFEAAGAAVGVAHWPSEAATPEEAQRLADDRMYAHKRRQYAQQAPTAPTGELVVSVRELTARCGARRVALRPIEARLLAHLAAFQGAYLSREDLAGVAGTDPGEALTAQLANLRVKVKDLAPHLAIRSQRGAGYALLMVGGERASR